VHATLKPRYALAVLAIGTIALAACGDDSGSSSASTAAAGSTSAAATSAAATSESASTSAASTTAAASAEATVAMADNAAIGQPILVNAAGMTIYLFVPDGTSTTSAVPEGIKANWPPVVADGTPVAGDGIDASKLAVAPQPDGTMQVTYNGHLLYTFLNDVAPGDAKGQDLGDAWYVVSPAGAQVG
jgi:predicted lipoprotein with Yx(FWY)xxD motif